MPWKKQVGERVSQLRKERHLSRAEFGKLIGVSERYVGNIERGNHTITGAVIAKMCDKINVSADYVLFGTYDSKAAIAELNDFSYEQAQLILNIAMNVIQFLHTPAANNALIQEVFRQHRPTSVNSIAKI